MTNVTSQASDASAASAHRGTLYALLFGALFVGAVLAEVPFVNGPEYWRWPWHYWDFSRALQAFAAPAILYGYLLQRWSGRSSQDLEASEIKLLIFGLTLCGVMAMAAGLYVRPKALAFTIQFVRHEGATSYFTDALKIDGVRAFLRDFATLPRAAHSETHPPAPILFWWLCIQLVRERLAPLLGTAFLGVAASLGAPLIYAFAGLWTREASLRLGASFLWVWLPGLIVNLPEMDQIYPLLSMLSLISWHGTLQGKRFAAVALGLTFFANSMFAYNLFTLGAPMLLYAALALWRTAERTVALKRAGGAVALALLVFVGAHIALSLLTGYDAIESFRYSIMRQSENARVLGRPYLPALFFDVYDFFLAAGMLPVFLTVLALASPGAHTKHSRELSIAFLLSILIIDLSGILRCETSRVWLFLQPLLLVPAGLHLARASAADRTWLMAMQVLIVMTLRCKMEFFP